MVYTTYVAVMYQVEAKGVRSTAEGDGRVRRRSARVGVIARPKPARCGGRRIVWLCGMASGWAASYGNASGRVRIARRSHSNFGPKFSMFRLHSENFEGRLVTVEFGPKFENLVQTNTRGCTNSGLSRR